MLVHTHLFHTTSLLEPISYEMHTLHFNKLYAQVNCKHTRTRTITQLSVCVCYFSCVSVEDPCVHGRSCSCCRFLSVVSGPKVSSSTVTFGPSQDLLCLTTMVWGSSSADDTRPSSVGCVWAGSRVTGPGWEMAADTGVTEPKGHEESHRDGEKHRQGDGGEPEERTTSLGSICVPLMLSCSVSLYFLSSTPGSAFFLSSVFSHLFPLSLSLSLSLSAARSTALVASGNAVRSPLSLCDGGMACGVKGAMKRWRPSERGNTPFLHSVAIFYCP